MGDEPFVTVLRTTDPVRAEVLRDLLQQEGIPVTITGQHHNSLLGAAGFLIEIPVQVPQDRAEEATAIINALDDESSVMVDEHGQPTGLGDADAEPDFGPETKREEGAGPYRSAPKRRKRPEQPRLKRVASFLAAAIGLGTGHHYAREYVAGSILTVSELAAFGVGLEIPAAMLAVPLLRVIDLVGSWRACERYNAGAPLGTGAQLVRTAGLVAGSFGLSVVGVPPLVEALRPDPEPVPEPRMHQTSSPAYDVVLDVQEVTADDVLDGRERKGTFANPRLPDSHRGGGAVPLDPEPPQLPAPEQAPAH